LRKPEPAVVGDSDGRLLDVSQIIGVHCLNQTLQRQFYRYRHAMVVELNDDILRRLAAFRGKIRPSSARTSLI
jgi:hypothetical protein